MLYNITNSNCKNKHRQTGGKKPRRDCSYEVNLLLGIILVRKRSEKKMMEEKGSTVLKQ